jgi:hypothetical protein
MELIPAGSYVCIETDSQRCTDGLRVNRKRWEKHGWRLDSGKPVENAEIIMALAKEINLRIVGLPRGEMFRIYPVDMDIQRLGDDDHAYSFDWVEGKQYWFDTVHDHDHARDKHDLCRQIRMVDYGGRVDTLVVPCQTNIRPVGEIWRKIIGAPEGVNLDCASRNTREYYWGFGNSTVQMIPCTLRSRNNQGNATIHDGSDILKAKQIGRITETKVPPFELCRITPRSGGGAIIEMDGDWVPLGLRVIRDHD